MNRADTVNRGFAPRGFIKPHGRRYLVLIVGLGTFGYAKPGSAHTFSNPVPITIPSSGPATTYGSTIVITGLTAPVTSVRLTIDGLSHEAPDDLDILLVGPTGIKVLVMSDAGGNAAISDVDLTIADGAASMPDELEITSGSYSPSNYAGADGVNDPFFGPAPIGPYPTTLLSFAGAPANGTWTLYVQDDSGPGGSGTIANGWSLTIVDPPLGTGFTYQGRLRDDGMILNGLVDLRFTLTDGTGGTVGSAVTLADVAVADGLFTVELNTNGEFGPDAFDGEARFLEVAVANPAGSSFATLSPTQPLTGAPYATTAGAAFTLDAPGEGPQAVFVDEAGKVGVGTSNPLAKLHISGTPGVDGLMFPDGTTRTTASDAFGNGSDGDFHLTSGTTFLEQGRVYQYSSFTLDAGATISATSTSSKPLIIYVQGDASINGIIDLKGKGSTTSYGLIVANRDGIFGFGTIAGIGNEINGNQQFNRGGVKGLVSWNFTNDQFGFVMNGTRGSSGGQITDGGSGGTKAAGGGGGASSINDGGSGNGGLNEGQGPYGQGGQGGCSLVLIVGGSLTFGASSVVDVSGQNGTNGNGASSPGGGGGGSGDILMFYNGALTDGGGSKLASGGVGGAQGGGTGANGQVKLAKYDTVFWGVNGLP